VQARREGDPGFDAGCREAGKAVVALAEEELVRRAFGCPASGASDAGKASDACLMFFLKCNVPGTYGDTAARREARRAARETGRKPLALDVVTREDLDFAKRLGESCPSGARGTGGEGEGGGGARH
jgi:hypothetical protein